MIIYNCYFNGYVRNSVCILNYIIYFINKYDGIVLCMNFFVV